MNAYVGYSEGSRAATSIELGCADPDEPCKLPNAMAGDPPLDQVVTRTLDAGGRGEYRGVNWSAGVFRAANRDDILFVTSDQTGFGYFRNFGETRRQGIELCAQSPAFGRVTLGAGYTYLDATFESEETVNGEGNSSNDAAEDGEPGLEGTDRHRARRPDSSHSGAHAQGVRRHPGDVSPFARREPDRRLELCSRAATRTIATSPTASTTSDPARRPATPSSTSARATS